MKKLLSLLLAAVMLLSMASLAAPALRASADIVYFNLYAYKSDGTFDLYDASDPSGGLAATYDNNSMISVGGSSRRVLDLAISPQFLKQYEALYIETFAPELVRLYVNGEVPLVSKKMEQGGETFYAALAASCDMYIYPMSSDAVLSLNGGFRGTLDAPLSLLRLPSDKSARVYSRDGSRMRLKTFLDLRYLVSDGGYSVSPAEPKLHLWSSDYQYSSLADNYVSREPLATAAVTELYLHGSSVLDLRFNGGNDTTNVKALKTVTYVAPFSGASYMRIYKGLGPSPAFDGVTESDYESSMIYHNNTYTSAVMSKLAPPAGDAAPDTESVTSEEIRKAIGENLVLKIGEPFKDYFNSGRLAVSVKWEDGDGNPIPADAVVETGKTYVATLYMCPIVRDDWKYATVRSQDYWNESAPATVANVRWTKLNPGYLCGMILQFHPISDKAPKITQQPTARTVTYHDFEAFTPETLTYTVKAENGSVQWHGIDRLGIDTELHDGILFSDTRTECLTVLKPGYVAGEYKEFYAVVSANGYEPVASEHAAIKTEYRCVAVIVKDLEPPVAGAPADTDCTVTVSPAFTTNVTASVVYYDAETMSKKTTFAKGDKLLVRVIVTLNSEGYRFADKTMGKWNTIAWGSIYGDKKTVEFDFPYTVVGSMEIPAVPIAYNFPKVDESSAEYSYLEAFPENSHLTVWSFEVKNEKGASDPYILPGLAYTVTFTVGADDDYLFSEDTVFSVNGDPVEATLSNGNKIATLSYTFPAQTVEVKPVEEVQITDLDAPTAGVDPDTEFNATSEECTITLPRVTYTVTGHPDSIMSAFAARDQVTLNVRMRIFGHSRVFTEATKATWNGMEAFAEDIEEDGRIAVFRFNWLVREVADEIPLVSLRLPVEAGAPRPVSADDVQVLSGGITVFSVLVFPYDAELKEGVNYTAQIQIAANGDDKFAETCEFYVNGELVTLSPLLPGTKSVTVTYEFTPGAAKKTGDVDGNGEITPGDARLALRISLGLMKDGEVDMTPDMVARADADGKDGVQPADARLILRKSLGIVDPEWVD